MGCYRSAHAHTAIYISLHAVHDERSITVLAAEQDAANLRAGLLASTVNGLAPMQGDMAPGSVIVSIDKHRSVAATVCFVLQRVEPAAASSRIIGSHMCATL